MVFHRVHRAGAVQRCRNATECVTYQPDRPHCGCWPQTCHISDVYWWEPTACAGSSLSSLLWWATGVCSLETQVRDDVVSFLLLLKTKLKVYTVDWWLIGWYFCMQWCSVSLWLPSWDIEADLNSVLTVKMNKWISQTAQRMFFVLTRVNTVPDTSHCPEHWTWVYSSVSGRFTFEQVSHQCKVEVGAEVEAHKVIHLLTVPL